VAPGFGEELRRHPGGRALQAAENLSEGMDAIDSLAKRRNPMVGPIRWSMGRKSMESVQAWRAAGNGQAVEAGPSCPAGTAATDAAARLPRGLAS
jgi:hypothetical protein